MLQITAIITNWDITISWNKYQSWVAKHTQKRYLKFLISTNYQEVNIHFELSFEIEEDRRELGGYYLPNVEKNYVMIDGEISFDQPVRNGGKHMKIP